MVADKLERQWSWEVYFWYQRLIACTIKVTREAAAEPDFCREGESGELPI